MFDVENYNLNGEEVRYDDPKADLSHQDLWSENFFKHITAFGIIPMVHPGSFDAYLVRKLFEASGGHGVVMLEGFGGGGRQLESYLTDLDSYATAKLAHYVVETVRWKRKHPLIKASWMTTETALRNSAAHWRDNEDGGWDIFQSTDDLSWMVPYYRNFDTDEGDGSHEPGPQWMWKETEDSAPELRTYTNTLKALGSRWHYLQSYDSRRGDNKTSNNIGLTHVWQFGNRPDRTDRITSIKDSRSGTTLQDLFWRSFYSARYSSFLASAEYEENQKTQPGSRAYAILRRGVQARYYVLTGAHDPLARYPNIEPWIEVPAGIDMMDEWSTCMTFIVHGGDYGADGLNPWQRGMSLLNRWSNSEADQFFYTELFERGGTPHLRIRVRYTNADGSGAPVMSRILSLAQVVTSSQRKIKVFVSLKKIPVWTWRIGCVQESEIDGEGYGTYSPELNSYSRMQVLEFTLPPGSSLPLAGFAHEQGTWGDLEITPYKDSETAEVTERRRAFQSLPDFPAGVGFPSAVRIGSHDVHLRPSVRRDRLHRPWDWPDADVVQRGSLYGVEVLDLAVWNRFGTMIPLARDVNGKLSEDQWPYNSWRIEDPVVELPIDPPWPPLPGPRTPY